MGGKETQQKTVVAVVGKGENKNIEFRSDEQLLSPTLNIKHTVSSTRTKYYADSAEGHRGIQIKLKS